MIPVALLAGAAVGAGQLAYGAHLKKKAQQAADANVMPEYKIAPEEGQMLRQAESMAGQGMSDAARAALRADTDRAQGTSIDAILRGGGNPNAISALAGNTQAGLNQMAVYEDQERLKHLRGLQEARARMSSNRDKDYQINKYQPWANKAQAITQQLAGAQNMQMSGLNTLTGGVLQSLGTIGAGARPIPTGYTGTPQNMPPMQQAQPQPSNWQPGYAQPQMYQPQQPSSYLDILNPPTEIPQWNGVTFQ